MIKILKQRKLKQTGRMPGGKLEPTDGKNEEQIASQGLLTQRLDEATLLKLKIQAMGQGFEAIILNLMDLQDQNHDLENNNKKLREKNNELRVDIEKILEENKHQSRKLLSDPAFETIETVDKVPTKTPTKKKQAGDLPGKEPLKNVTEYNKSLIAENFLLVQQNGLLEGLKWKLVENTYDHKVPCGCDKRSFKRKKREPLKDDAVTLYADGLSIAKDKFEEKKEKQKKVYDIIIKMLREAITEYRREYKKKNGKGLTKSQRTLQYEIMRDQVGSITSDLISVNDIGVHQVAYILNETQIDPGKPLDVVSTSPGRFRELVKVLGAKRSTELYFQMLKGTIRNVLTMNIPEVWREKEGESKADKSLRYDAAGRANIYCEEFLGKHELNKEIRRINSIRRLQEIVRECMLVPEHLPVTEENFQRLVSAVTKIRMMHLAETIKSQIDFKENDRISAHIKAKMEAFTERTPEGKTVLTIGIPSRGGIYKREDKIDKYSIVVDGIEVRAGKGEMAVARKFMIKDTGENQFDPNRIYDYQGLRIWLTEEDSANLSKEEGVETSKPPVEKATKKILGILCAIFGTDIYVSRLRYRLDVGNDNKHGTGKHRAFHVTFRYRHQCKNNGMNGNGFPNMKPTYLEVQIVVHMDKEGKAKDHEEYKRKKDMKIQNTTGMDRSFYVWLADLVDVILDDEKQECAALSEDNIYAYTHKEIMARILFEALTRRDEKRKLVNIDTIRLMVGNDKRKKKLIKAAKQYSDYQPWFRKNKKRKGMNVSTAQVKLNKLAAEALQVVERVSK